MGDAPLSQCIQMWHAQNNSLEEMYSQLWYVLPVGIWVRSELLQRICWPGLHRRLLEWAVVRTQGFCCGCKSCWVSKGHVPLSVALGSSMPGGQGALHCRPGCLTLCPSPSLAQPPPFPYVSLALVPQGGEGS